MDMPAERWARDVIERLRAVRCRQGKYWDFCCQAHDDRQASATAWMGRQGDRVMVGCRAGCSKSEVLAAVGLTMRDLYAPKDGGERPSVRPVLWRTYPYMSAEGELLYEVCRYKPKSFRQRRPHPADPARWLWNLDGVRLVPFMLPDLAACRSAAVYVCEGEEDALAARRLGLLATTGCGGCGMGWLDEYSACLRGRHVVLLPDDDAAGQKHMDRAAGSLLRHGVAGLRIVRLPHAEAGKGGDLRDWLRAGGTREALDGLVSMEREYRS